MSACGRAPSSARKISEALSVGIPAPLRGERSPKVPLRRAEGRAREEGWGVVLPKRVSGTSARRHTRQLPRGPLSKPSSPCGTRRGESPGLRQRRGCTRGRKRPTSCSGSIVVSVRGGSDAANLRAEGAGISPVAAVSSPGARSGRAPQLPARRPTPAVGGAAVRRLLAVKTATGRHDARLEVVRARCVAVVSRCSVRSRYQLGTRRRGPARGGSRRPRGLDGDRCDRVGFARDQEQ